MSETKRILNAVVIQADYFAKPDPDEEILSFLFSELERIPENSIVLLPEYTKACGLSGKDRIIFATLMLTEKESCKPAMILEGLKKTALMQDEEVRTLVVRTGLLGEGPDGSFVPLETI